MCHHSDRPYQSPGRERNVAIYQLAQRLAGSVSCVCDDAFGVQIKLVFDAAQHRAHEPNIIDAVASALCSEREESSPSLLGVPMSTVRTTRQWQRNPQAHRMVCSFILNSRALPPIDRTRRPSASKRCGMWEFELSGKMLWPTTMRTNETGWLANRTTLKAQCCEQYSSSATPIN